jgi:hypothetical protein
LVDHAGARIAIRSSKTHYFVIPASTAASAILGSELPIDVSKGNNAAITV